MFKNSVFKANVDTVKWVKASIVRAIKTMAQVAVSMISVGATIGEVDWLVIGSTSLVAGIVSILTSVAGIPEVEAK